MLLSLLLANSADVSAVHAEGTTEAGRSEQAVEEPGRSEFIAAMRRVRERTAEPPDPDTLKRFPIYDYLVAARLRRDLAAMPDEPLDSKIDRFVSAHAGQPVTRALRSEWLTSLASRARWDWFLPRATELNSAQLICDRLAGRLATGDKQGLATEALARWGLAQRPPPECEPVFAWLRGQGLLTAALAEKRTRTALEAGNPRLAREFVADVPADAAAPLLLWTRLLETPKPVLQALASQPAMDVEPTALEAGFSKLARTDSAAALEVLPGLLSRPGLAPELRGRLQRAAALGAAYDHDPQAIAAFVRLPADAVDADVRDWRVRAALWAGDFQRALAWIAQMPAAQAAEPRWRYWRARAVAATSGAKAAEPLFADVAGLRDFYGYLAADRIRSDYQLNAHPSTAVDSEQRELAARPGLIRAHALFDCDMTDDAIAEWSVALANTSAAIRLQAALLAADWGWYAQSISTLAQVGELDDVRLRYPRPYPEAIAQASRLTHLPPDWILAVMRQESLFRSDAVSPAGARGLMQMQPRTAAAVDRRWHLGARASAMSSEPGFDPSSDVKLGAAYLRELLDRYDGQLELSLAAYNAGPVPVSRWLPPKAMDADIWIENIPYGETRSYVQRILEHIVAFAWVRGAQPPRLSTLLPRVVPASISAQAARRPVANDPPSSGPQHPRRPVRASGAGPALQPS